MVHEEDIVQIMQSIWMSILDLPIMADEGGKAKVDGAEDRTLTGCVQLTGDFEGAVMLYCTRGLARQVASVMFEVEPDNLTVEEIQDALGEVTNMAAGNIKPLLPGTSRLSLPSVVEGLDYSVIVPGSQVENHVGFDCEGLPLVLTLVRRKGQK